MNALLGVVRPGDLGLDCIHINVHKTFSTPHGAGGPGAGPLCVKTPLEPFLPDGQVVRAPDGSYRREGHTGQSVGWVRSLVGNFGVLVRAYTYMKTLGGDGMVETSNDAILAANYLLARLRGRYQVAYDRTPMHEFVLTAAPQKKKGASALDIAKALIDEGFHPSSVYFPLIVPEAMMIEPTETEPKETLDAFADALIRIADRVDTDPESLHDAPLTAPLRRLDEVSAARKPVLRWKRPS
jgi:glycine dehydrogenase subunit 2